MLHHRSIDLFAKSFLKVLKSAVPKFGLLIMPGLKSKPSKPSGVNLWYCHCEENLEIHLTPNNYLQEEKWW